MEQTAQHTVEIISHAWHVSFDVMSSDFVIQRCADRLIIFINTTSSERPLPLQCCQWYVGLASAQTSAPLGCVSLVPEKTESMHADRQGPLSGP
ncbi:hypothetical protein QQF64_012319 [Cirrhinus molitorella]|uniref:Uncharacterized protein n=1 Tax=Cirrhinus molitorella TaxID=172907 RepID=A0ABR3LV72_9TELE